LQRPAALRQLLAVLQLLLQAQGLLLAPLSCQ
jgi:hypothetical protein